MLNILPILASFVAVAMSECNVYTENQMIHAKGCKDEHGLMMDFEDLYVLGSDYITDDSVAEFKNLTDPYERLDQFGFMFYSFADLESVDNELMTNSKTKNLMSVNSGTTSKSRQKLDHLKTQAKNEASAESNSKDKRSNDITDYRGVCSNKPSFTLNCHTDNECLRGHVAEMYSRLVTNNNNLPVSPRHINWYTAYASWSKNVNQGTKAHDLVCSLAVADLNCPFSHLDQCDNCYGMLSAKMNGVHLGGQTLNQCVSNRPDGCN